jgi:hypothetical protein
MGRRGIETEDRRKGGGRGGVAGHWWGPSWLQALMLRPLR